MAVTPYTKVSSASIAGLVTDGNALLSTDQSNLDEANYELLRDGTRRRRRPIVQETDGATTFLGSSANSLRSSYLWQTPAFRDNYSILCEENNGDILFYEVDHDNPSYMRRKEVSNDRLRLELWGTGDFNRVDHPQGEIACTYTEGNGSLYVFNSRAGTIKVDLLDDNTLRMSPINTWVRDYRGAAERDQLDYRRPRVAPINTFAASNPFIDPEEEVLITSELGAQRAYNLSNTGWDAKAISEFMIQSDQDYTVRDGANPYISEGAQVETISTNLISSNTHYTVVRKVINNPSLWPAVTDKYLAGRQVDDRGIDQFSFPQLIQAKDSTNPPPMGARIGVSEFSPAGSLSGVPVERKSSTATLVSGDNVSFDVTFNKRQQHYRGFRADNISFVHSLTFTVQKDGRTYQGGLSGALRTTFISDDGLTSRFYLPNGRMSGYANIELKSLYMHPSPEYFPDNARFATNAYDYADTKARPLAGAFFAGRLWQTSDGHNRLYYSQVVDVSTSITDNPGPNLESLCFAYADPTDGDDNSVVATDGGYVNSNDSGTHYGLVTLGDSLLLLTDRGIWAIRPGSGNAFSASDYQYVKVVGAEVLGSQAFVSTGDQVHVATDEGILVLSMQSSSFGNTSVQVERVLDNRLMNAYDDIVDKWPNPTAGYDPESRVVRWLFRPKLDNYPDEGQPVLSYSMYHNSWYKYVLGADSRVFDMVVLPYAANTSTYNKFRYLVGGLSSPTSNVYLTGWGVEVEFGPEGTGLWVQNGVRTVELFADYRPLPADVNNARESPKAFMLTNHMLPGEAIKWSQINYIVVHNRNVTETWRDVGNNIIRPSVDGGTLLSIRWDWMNQKSTGKWADPYQTYRYRRSYLPTGITEDNKYGEPVLVHKMKLRGRGREFRLFFESDGHKDSHIEGWAYQGYILNEV